MFYLFTTGLPVPKNKKGKICPFAVLKNVNSSKMKKSQKKRPKSLLMTNSR